MKNKVLMMLLSLVISFGIWLYVVTVISPESEATYYNIPVELVGTEYLDERNLMIISDKKLDLDLTLKGNRTDLNQLNSSNITILADLSKIDSAGEHDLKVSISYPGEVKAEVLKKNPQTLTVQVAEQMSKSLEVRVNYIGSVVAGYEADMSNVSLDHTTVTIRGPKEVVERIAYAGITVDLTGKMATFVWDYPLMLYGLDGRPLGDESFITSNVTEIRTGVQVYKVKRIPVTVLLDDTKSGLQSQMVTVYPSMTEITIAGQDAALDQIHELVLGTVYLKDLEKNTTLSFSVNLPEGVRCKDGVESISVDVQLPEMGTKTMTVNRFMMTNMPDNLLVRVTGLPEVKIWGPQDILDMLTIDDLLGIVDCSGVTLSSGYAPVNYVVESYLYLQVRVDWSNVFISVEYVPDAAEG